MTQDMCHRVLIVRAGPGRGSLDDWELNLNKALQELRAVTGMHFVAEQILPSDPDVDFCTWTDERLGRGQISLVENRHLGVLYVQLGLASDADCESAAQTISKHVPIWSIAELQETASAAAGTDGAVLAKLGLASPPGFDPTTARLITAGLTSDRPDVREGAIYAAFLLKWPAFQQPIADALAREDRDDLRRMLEAAAAVCDPASSGSGEGDPGPH